MCFGLLSHSSSSLSSPLCLLSLFPHRCQHLSISPSLTTLTFLFVFYVSFLCHSSYFSLDILAKDISLLLVYYLAFQIPYFLFVFTFFLLPSSSFSGIANMYAPELLHLIPSFPFIFVSMCIFLAFSPSLSHFPATTNLLS